MQQIGQILRAIFGVIEKVLEVLSMLMLSAMVLIICYQVVMALCF